MTKAHMQLMQGQAAAMQAKIWIGFFLYAMRRYWWLVGACIIVGVVGGYYSALRTPNTYEVRASFLVQSDDALVEYERIISRSLVTKAVNAESKFEVSSYVHTGFRDPIEMYNGSPFQIQVIAFPDFLRNKEHHITLFNDHSYEISIHTPQKTLTERGTAGVPLSIGSVKIVVDASPFWNENAAQGNYSFVVQSDQALASRFLRNLDVIHSLDHPNRISLHYKDAHPERAFDLLKAFTQAYLDDCKFRRDEFMRERKREITGQLRVLETEILRSSDTAFWNQLETQGLMIQDSSIVNLLRLQQEMEVLKNRLQLWSDYRKGGLTLPVFQERLHGLASQDTTLQKLLSDPRLENADSREAAMARITAEVDSLAQHDARTQAMMEAEIIQTHTDYLAAYTLGDAWKRDWVRGTDLVSPNLNAVLVESYLSALAEATKLELEVRESFVSTQLIDPPYNMPGHGRSFKIRTLMGWVFGLAMLGAFLAVIASLGARRFGSLYHFQGLSGLDTVKTWKLTENELLRRKQATQLELSLRPEDKVIALMGQTPEVDRLADAMAAGFIAFGKRVLVLNSIFDGEVAWERLSIPQSTQPGWWFSAQAAAFLKEKSAVYDRIVLCLPPPSQAPEVAGAIRQADVTYFILQKNSTRVAEWRAWKQQAQDLGIQAQPIFVIQS